MKKRRGYIRRKWKTWDAELRGWVVTEVTDQPVDPDRRAIPNACWHADDGNHLWIEREEDAEARAEWYEAQDALDEVAANLGRVKGGETRAEQQQSDAEKVSTWLYPLLAEAESIVLVDYARAGVKRLMRIVLGDETTAGLLPERSPRRKYVTQRRVKDWIENGRPRS